MYTTFHPISEVETTALWLPILGKCPEIYRVIVMGLRPSRWPSKKDWLDASNESASLTLFYLRIKRILFLSININFIYFRQNFSYTNTKLSIRKSVRALKKKNVIDKTRLFIDRKILLVLCSSKGKKTISLTETSTILFRSYKIHHAEYILS